jgi:hypothetical protein
MHTTGGISGKRRGPLAAKAAPMGRRYKSRPLRLPATSPMSSALPIPQPRARIFALRARVRGARKRLPSKNGERRPRRLCGGVEEEARPLLCRRRQVHGTPSLSPPTIIKLRFLFLAFACLLLCLIRTCFSFHLQFDL